MHALQIVQTEGLARTMARVCLASAHARAHSPVKIARLVCAVLDPNHLDALVSTEASASLLGLSPVPGNSPVHAPFSTLDLCVKLTTIFTLQGTTHSGTIMIASITNQLP
jgi:hypothetical protein